METQTSTAKLMFLETRPQFLTLVPCVLAVGVGMAVLAGYFNGLHLVLALIGTVLVHASVNILNDYTDWVRGTDKLVKRTPFSGGSGLLPAGALTQRQVLLLGIGTLTAAMVIGAYFVYVYPILLWVVVPGALLTVLYTPLLTKVYITEIFPGIGLGFLPVIGAYVTQLPPESAHIPVPVYLAAIPAGILVAGLLWINEFPDYDADIATGRRHGVIAVGRKNAAVGYVILLVLTYVSLIVPVALGLLPPLALLGLLTLPLAFKAGTGALKNFDRHDELIPVLGQNVMTVLATPALMAVGIIISSFL